MRRRRSDTAAPRRPTAATATLIILVVAATLRLVALDRFPPGLHFDEAVYGLLANDIVQGARPVFFSSYTGREPLYMYLMAALFRGIGATSMSIRLTSAFVGIATVAVTFALGRTFYDRRVGVVAAGLIAVSYWHLTVSRNGYPNILIPLLEALSAILLWRAWRAPDSRRLEWVLGGACTGLVLYTYLAARFWPVFVLVFSMYLAVVARHDLRRNAAGIALAAVAAAAVFAPLGLHFWRHPNDFLERANQVLAWEQLEGPALLQAYSRNMRETFAGLLGRGDPRWHYNLPGRAVFQPLVGLFFLVGVALCARRWRDPRYGFPLLWIAVLVLPGVLTLEMQPAGQRIFGVFPALVLVPAIGLVTVARHVGRRMDPWLYRRRASRDEQRRTAHLASGLGISGGVLVTLVLFADGVTTTRDYFADWVRQPETYHIFNADYAAAAPEVVEDLAAGNTVVLLTEHYKHATLAFLAPEAVDDAVWADPAIALPIPVPRGRAGRGDLVYYRLASYPDGDAPALAWLETHATEVEHLPSGFDEPTLAGRSVPPLDVVRYVVPWPPEVPESDAEVWSFGGEISVRDTDESVLQDTMSAALVTDGGRIRLPRDEDIVVPVEWTVTARPDQGRGFALHLRDARGVTWSQADLSGYLSEQWSPGDRVLQWFTLPAEPTAPPGRYTAELMLVDAAARPIPALRDGRVRPSAPVATVDLTRDGERRAGGDVEPLAMLGDGLGIVAAGSLDAEATPGSAVMVDVLWGRFGDASSRDISFALVPEQGAAIGLGSRPVADGYAPDKWSERELLSGRYSVQLPADLPDGAYGLVVARDSSVPPDVDADGAPDPGYLIGTVRVAVGERRFDTPEMGHAFQRARFGSAVSLLGFDVADEPVRPGGQVTLTLYWRSDDAPTAEAKVFVHLLDSDDRLLAQHDGVPSGGTRPLRGWLPGEVIVDRHVIDVPADLGSRSDAYTAGDGLTLGVGLYAPDSGERWAVEVSAAVPDDRRLLLPVRLEVRQTD